MKAKLDLLEKPPLERTQEEWDSLSYTAAATARSREVSYIQGLLCGQIFQGANVSTALEKSGWLEELMELNPPKEITARLMDKHRVLLAELEQDHFGVKLGMHLHLEHNLTMDDITKVVSPTHTPPRRAAPGPPPPPPPPT
jgi:hypothetical protein